MGLRAAERIAQIVSKEPENNMLRVSVEGGGCSGFEHRFDLVPNAEPEDILIDRLVPRCWSTAGPRQPHSQPLLTSIQHPVFYRYRGSCPRRNGSPRNCCSRAGDERNVAPVFV